MAAINFPTATADGQTFEADTGVIYTYNGTPPNGFWSGSFQTTGLNTLDSRYIAKDDDGTVQTIKRSGLKINDNSNDTILLNSDGSASFASNVGIGTTAPDALLTVSGVNNIHAHNASGDASIALSTGGTPASPTQKYTLFVDDSDGDKFIINDSTAAQRRLVIDGSGNVGIGTTSPSEKLEVNSGTGNTPLKLVSTDGSVYIQLEDSATTAANRVGAVGNNLVLHTNNSESLRIDSAGRMLLGTSTSTSSNGQSVSQVASTSNDRAIAAYNYENDASGPYLSLGKSRGTSVGSFAILQDNDELGNIAFFAADGTDLNTEGARIQAEVDGTPSANDMPTRLVFATTSDGANNPAERLRIDSSGNVGIGTTSPSTLLHVSSAVGDGITIGGNNAGSITRETEGLRITGSSTNRNISFVTSGTEAMRVDTSGRLLVGTSSSVGPNNNLQLAGTTNDQTTITCWRSSSDAGAGGINFIKTRGTVGSPSVASNGDRLGTIRFHAYDGSTWDGRAAEILGEVDGGVSAGGHPRSPDIWHSLGWCVNSNRADAYRQLRQRRHWHHVACKTITHP